MPYGTVQADKIQGSINSLSPDSSVFRNRIINGAMQINQRGFGATPANFDYLTDRFQFRATQSSKFTSSQSSTAPTGFINSLLFTSSAATTPGSTDQFGVRQFIEGLNISDLAWGTANAKAVTLSFWVRSSLTGTHSGALGNSGDARAYPFSYTISVADTWEYKTITIAGDTSGTWLTTNGIGIKVSFNLGAGSSVLATAGAWTTGEIVGATGSVNVCATNGATFYITGVQLEVGSTATSFDYRPYSQELALCQRYYYKITPNSSAYPLGSLSVVTTTIGRCQTFFPVSMRTKPTALEQSGTASDYSIATTNISTTCSSVPTFNNSSVNFAATNMTVASGLTAGQAGEGRGNATGYLAWSAEL